MKNKYNLLQIAEVYCREIGVDVPFMYDYLVSVFKKLPLEEYEEKFKDVETISEFFPELKKPHPLTDGDDEQI